MFLAQRCGTRGDGFRFTHCDENNPGGIHSKNSWLLSAALWMFTCQLPPTDHFIRAMLTRWSATTRSASAPLRLNHREGAERASRAGLARWHRGRHHNRSVPAEPPSRPQRRTRFTLGLPRPGILGLGFRQQSLWSGLVIMEGGPLSSSLLARGW